MKTIDAIVIHCSATPEGLNVTTKEIDAMHRQKGWKMIGYNYVIELDGSVHAGRPLTMNGAHALGYNDHSIGICYIGGVEGTIKDGRIVAKKNARGRDIPKDTRTPAQKAALVKLVYELMDKYPSIKEVIGHRDTSPDINGNGTIEPSEWIKSCPCFDVRSEFPMAVCVAKKK